MDLTIQPYMARAFSGIGFNKLTGVDRISVTRHWHLMNNRYRSRTVIVYGFNRFRQQTTEQIHYLKLEVETIAIESSQNQVTHGVSADYLSGWLLQHDRTFKESSSIKSRSDPAEGGPCKSCP